MVKYLCRYPSRNLGSSHWSFYWSHKRDGTRVLASIGHSSEWQFNWLSNKDAFKLTAIILNNLFFFSAVAGLEIRPSAKLNHNRTEGLPTYGKEGRRRGKHFFFAQRCNCRGESKRGRMPEWIQLYAPLIERWKWLPLEREVRLTRIGWPTMQRDNKDILHCIDINNIWSCLDIAFDFNRFCCYLSMFSLC